MVSPCLDVVVLLVPASKAGAVLHVDAAMLLLLLHAEEETKNARREGQRKRKGKKEQEKVDAPRDLGGHHLFGDSSIYNLDW